MIRSRLTVAVLAAAAVTLPAASPAPAQKPFYGVNPQGALSQLQQRDFNMMRRARIGTIRFSANRDVLERGDGGFNWQHIDRAVGLAAARGIRSLPVIYQDGGPRTNRDRRVLRRFAREMARRYAPRGEFWRERYARYSGGAKPQPILAWQFLNEQNSRSHWVTRPRPRAYGRALRMASRAIRRVHRRAGVRKRPEIVLGGMFVNPRGRGSLPSFRYLNRLYRVKGIKRFFDTVAVHPYARNLRGIRRQIRRMRRVMRRNGHRRAGIRVTELGWSSARGRHRLGLLKGPRGQARMLRRSFRVLSNNRGRWNVRGLNWFGWQDITRQPGGGRRVCNWCPDAGLVTVNGDPKRSFRAFRAMTGR